MEAYDTAHNPMVGRKVVWAVHLSHFAEEEYFADYRLDSSKVVGTDKGTLQVGMGSPQLPGLEEQVTGTFLEEEQAGSQADTHMDTHSLELELVAQLDDTHTHTPHLQRSE
jgi:hypothetical protein